MAIKTKITRQDLKIYPSERLTQTDDGGGMPTGKPLTGALNELFQPIGSVAWLNGAFYAVLEYAGVLRPDNAPLIAPFMCITRPPLNEAVSYLLFKASKFGETRAEVLNRIESYVIAGIESQMTLMSINPAGSRIVQAYQRVGETLPSIGDRFCLRQNKSGYETAEQYVQVTRIIESKKRTFTVNQKDFDRLVIKMEISSKLEHDFIGTNYPSETYVDSPCKILETSVVDAGQYYGVKPIVKAIKKDEKSIQISSIMEKIVPVTQNEDGIADVNPSEKLITIDAGYGTSKNMTISVPVQTYKEDIIASLRSYDYTAQLINPKLGTVTVEYLSQGKWYKLTDGGTGKIVGASVSHGSATLNKVTGSLVISLGNLPDVNSAIVVSYAKDVYQRPELKAQSYLPIVLESPATDITVSSNGKTGRLVNGILTGDITGTFDYANKTLKITPMAGLGDFTVNANSVTSDYMEDRLVSSFYDNEHESFTLTKTPVLESFINFTVTYTSQYHNALCAVRDDGNGGLIADISVRSSIDSNVAEYRGKQTIGTINYQTGVIILKKSITVNTTTAIVNTVKVGTQRTVTDGKVTATSIEEEQVVGNKVTPISYQLGGGLTEFKYVASTSTKATTVKTYSKPPLNIELNTGYPIVSGSFTFEIAGLTYFYKDGKIYQDNKEVGTLTDNQAVITDYVGGSVAIKSLLVKTSDDRVKRLAFTTPKIRPTSLKMTIDNEQAESKLDGNIMMNGNAIGSVDSEVGLVMIDKYNERYPLNDTARNDPRYAYFDKLVYQAVALSYLPIDKSIVKIDAVRLPPDGKIPIFRRGDDVLIGNRKVDNLGSAFTGGQTINLSRTNVDRICLNDADNKPVNAELWDYDLYVGSITFKTSIDLSPYKMPLSASHTQEMRNRITDLDIDGTLTLQFKMNRDYAIEDTFVSGMMLNEDLQVRVSVPFTQKNWDGVWRDTPNGSQLLNKLNLTDHPMKLTDDGAITADWLIKFTSSSQFELYSDVVGFVGKFDTLTDLAPINPATGKPYFIIPKEAFGNKAPWAAQDVIRFKTWGTLMPVWVLCAVQPTANPPTGEDGFEQYLFGDTTELTA